MYILAPGVESRQPFKYRNRGFVKKAKNGQQNIYTENMGNRHCRTRRKKESEGGEKFGDYSEAPLLHDVNICTITLLLKRSIQITICMRNIFHIVRSIVPSFKAFSLPKIEFISLEYSRGNAPVNIRARKQVSKTRGGRERAGRKKGGRENSALHS